MKILSVDIGGTTTKLALLNKKCEIIERYKAVKTQKGHSLKWLFDYIEENKIKYDAIGIDVPGFYNSKKGIVEKSGNLEYKNFNIVKEIKKYTNKPISVLNDANAAALGEYNKIFHDTDVNDVIFYILGTGVGGGIIINGKLHEGYNGFAGEFGHSYLLDNTKCSCGISGCIEPISSAVGITKLLNKNYKKSKNLIDLKNKDGYIELAEIKPFLKDDKEIIKIIEEAIDPLVRHVTTLAYSLNPQAIIIGGGPSGLGENFIKIISNSFKNRVADFIAKNTKIKKAICKNDAALYGNVYNIIND